MRLISNDLGKFFWSPDDPGEPSTGEPRHSVKSDEGAVLALMATKRRVLEVGTGLGVSTRAMASTCSYLYTVDIDPWVQKNVWPGFDPSKVVCVSKIPVEPFSFDMAFIDGDHSQESVMKDLRSCRKVLKPFSPIFLHDYRNEIRGEVVDACRRVGFVCIRRWGQGSSLAVGILP